MDDPIKNSSTVNPFNSWHGIDRNTIDWYPVIDESKCVGCGLCATTCGRKVYGFDYKKNKSKVVNPNNCMVACQTCANLCPVGAISFTKEPQTTREKAQEIMKETKVFANVNTELENKKGQLSVEKLGIQ
jgi:formate hydrogenlyase subunit 6/NADH:ubiquinone oxidoreductase subunit I